MKISNYVFIVAFLFIITIPFVLMDTKSEISKNENRVLAKLPYLNENISIDQIVKLPRSIDKYLEDRLGLKETAVMFIKNFTMKGFGKFKEGEVIFGKDGWLFYSDKNNNVNDYLKINLFSQNELDHFVKNLKDRFDWCKNNNIKFMFVISPNKQSVYFEYYPLEKPEGISRTEQIINALPSDLKDVVIYPRDYLVQKKKVSDMELYYKTDTHWNMLGASFASELILKKLQEFFPTVEFPKITYSQKIIEDAVKTDLPKMLGMAQEYNDRSIIMENKEGFGVSYKYIKPTGLTNHDFLIGWIGNTGKDGIITKNVNRTLPNAIIFRDSFFSALEPFTSEMFSVAEYNWRPFKENEKEAILKNKPDIIIWEIVERDLEIIADNLGLER